MKDQQLRDRICWLEIALAATQRLQDRKGEGVMLGNLGIATPTWARPAGAIQFYEQRSDYRT